MVTPVLDVVICVTNGMTPASCIGMAYTTVFFIMSAVENNAESSLLFGELLAVLVVGREPLGTGAGMIIDEDRVVILEIVRIEVRLAVQHLFDVLEHNRRVRTGGGSRGLDEPLSTSIDIDDDWVHKSPRP